MWLLARAVAILDRPPYEHLVAQRSYPLHSTSYNSRHDTSLTEQTPHFSCIILAGGEGSRMHGADKGLIDFHGKSMIEHVINAVIQDAGDIVISANRNLARYRNFGFPVIPDTSAQYAGPLAGILSSIPTCHHDWILVVACDMPLLPSNLVHRLYESRGDFSLIVTEVHGKPQLALLMRRELITSIDAFLQSGRRRLLDWLQSQQHISVDFSHNAETLRNFNRLDDFHIP